MYYRELQQKYRLSEKYLENYIPGKLCRIALGFPNTYRVGMGSLGFQIVYSILNNNPKCSAERFFLPETETDEIVTIETERNIGSFDAMGFSVSFEMDYPNILSILKGAKIPVLRKDRGENVPLVFAGGAITLINPFAISEFMDFFILGDGEEILDWVCDIISQNISKEEKLRLLSENSHILVPSFPKEIYEKRTVCNLSDYICHSVITTPYAEFGDTVLFEISRGCPRGCSFCAAGHIQKPFRLRKPVLGDDLPIYDSYGIVGAAVYDNPYSEDLCRKIADRGGKFSLSSIRLETLNEEKLSVMQKAGIKTVTIAPEAGTERLREYIGKKCSDEKIMNAVDLSYKMGIRKFKLYFMIGLPGETDEDIQGIIDLVSGLCEKYKKAHFTPSCGSFVPKPHTKYENMPMDREQSLKKKLETIKKALNKIKNADVSSESPRMAKIQAILSRADSDLGRDYLLTVMEEGWTSAGRKYREEIDRILYSSENTDPQWNKIRI
ncbi:MAG: radical SAM protein [Armatimonadetes bacterium]|nr:radical SAM protein [Candidatus Hippobium faecium]